MKKMFQLLTVVAVAAMGLTACSNEFDEPNSNSNQGDVVVTFVAEPEATRTSVDTSSDDAPVFSWNDSESFAVLEQTDVLAAATDVAYAKVEGKAHITATFNGNVGQGEYKYVTVYPASAYVEAESINAATLRLPAHQTMAEGSYDPDADLMVSKVVTTDVQPTEAQQVQFTRLVAVVKMTLKNFTAEQVEKVIFTAEGKSLAGTITTDLALPHAFTVAEGVSSVSVATTSNTDVYFNVLPTALEGGDSYTVTVLTSDKLYVKRGTISEGKTLFVYVSTGSDAVMVEVPDLLGKDKNTAIMMLSAANLTYQIIDEEYSDTYKAGVVITQSKPKGSEVTEGTEILLILSKGPNPSASSSSSSSSSSAEND